ncbi:putative cysteine protease ATG4 [Hanseniaspora osmophila]|uniref:Cysteine protease n=1 Tax=Hanseniaspora osmophila TaxID=56408 RepID=A0A1E5RNY3_9ASCO|nr:putative cysteine protease ATG4 [Hanseniaspora osmophila]
MQPTNTSEDKNLTTEEDPNATPLVCILGTIYEPEKYAQTHTKKAEEPAEPDLFMKVNNFMTSMLENTASNLTSMLTPTNNLHDEAIMKDIYTVILFTYRTDFEPIAKITGNEDDHAISVLLRAGVFAYYSNIVKNNANNSFITDVGWGCMIRTGQSLLANALQIIHYGRSYRYSLEASDNDTGKQADSSLTGGNFMNWFRDEFQYPFSIQNFVKVGYELSNKKPGEWFSPSAAARSIQKLVLSFPECGINNCYISIDSGTIYLDEVDRMFEKDDSLSRKTNVLILLCVRLGLSNLNEYYWNDIKGLLGLEGNTCGISGGKPSSSFYFFGYSNDVLLYLDPHSPKLHTKDPTQFAQSAHSTDYKTLPFSQVDPSMMLGFLIQGKEDWISFQEKIRAMNNNKGSRIVQFTNHPEYGGRDSVALDQHPPVSAGETESSYVECGSDAATRGTLERTESIGFASNGAAEVFSDTEDYVDIGEVLGNMRLKKASFDQEYDEFQEVQCKDQKIVTLKNDSDDVDNEEKVLCEQETVSLGEE